MNMPQNITFKKNNTGNRPRLKNTLQIRSLLIKGGNINRRNLTIAFFAALASATMLSVQTVATLTSSAWAQQQTDNAATGMKQLRITIDALKVNTDHDPLFEGEWMMDAYVNDHRVPLLEQAISVDNGETINFTQNNSVVVSVPQNGSLRLVTVGFESDLGFESLPDISTQLTNDIPYDLYVIRAQDLVESFTLFDANDPNGFVTKQFTAAENFGVGQHRDCSEPNVQATDPSGAFESACDFELFFTIEEVA